MSQSVRERIGELAVLKTVGFRDSTMLGIVLAESILIVTIGGMLGLLLGAGLAAAMSSTFASMMGIGLSLTPGALALGIGIMLATGVAAGLFPALKARRLTIVEALARG
jgi:putative ABC transport system permease protein